ncbi:MAG: hypothetical protein SGBAC_011418 [Bacillariaceae sp.]
MDDAPVQVFLRLRPLIAEEDGHQLIEHKICHYIDDGNQNDSNNSTNNMANQRQTFQLKPPSSSSSSSSSQSNEAPKMKFNPAFANAPPLRSRKDAWKSFDGFSKILQDDQNNHSVYQATISPLVTQLLTSSQQQTTPTNSQNKSAAIFTYGHTGSGKSHTLLGCTKHHNNGENEEELGIYKFAARQLMEQLHPQNKCLLVRVTEFYKENTITDLLTSESCSIRQNANGVVQVRGPIKEDEVGRHNQPILGQVCSSAQQVIDCVEAAVTARRVGISTHHSQSSRSHLILEFEVVTNELMDQRTEHLRREEQLTRLQWLQTEKCLGNHHDRSMPKWTEDYIEIEGSRSKAASKLENEIKDYEKLVADSKKTLDNLEKGLGGTLVFCDLAGNEYARDATTSTKEEMEEAAEINKSLLAVKEMIRNLNLRNKATTTTTTTTNTAAAAANDNDNATAATRTSNKKTNNHVPYRDSKLTMILRRHMDHKAIVLAHISPSQESYKKTINTLTYSSMVVVGGQKKKSRKKHGSNAMTAGSDSRSHKTKANKENNKS